MIRGGAMTPRESFGWEARRERQYSVYRSDRPGAGALLDPPQDLRNAQAMTSSHLEFYGFTPASTNNGAYGPDDLPKVSNPFLVVEQKFDGSFYVARFPPDCDVTFTSRRIGVKDGKPIEKGANLPHINMGQAELSGTLLIGEVIMRSGQFKDSAGIMNSKPGKALAQQGEHGFLTYMAFDCLWYKGADLRGKPFSERRQYLKLAVTAWKTRLEQNDSAARPTLAENVDVSPFIDKAPSTAFAEIVARGGEGIMLKDWNASYGAGVWKCKKFSDVSVVVTGYVEGKGKYSGQVGAIRFSVYADDMSTGRLQSKLVEIGQCSGMDDTTRLAASTGRERYVGQVMDVRCQPPDNPEKFRAGEDRLRHPRFIRFRTDLSSMQCTAAKLVSDFLGMKAVRP